MRNEPVPLPSQSRDPGVKTKATPNATWWDTPTHNVTEVTFTPPFGNATGLAALCWGHRIYWNRSCCKMRKSKAAMDFASEGEETRVIMFGFGHEHDTLLYSNDVADVNLFQDLACVWPPPMQRHRVY
jgi:peptide/nickel transport system substrate-binding protein